MPRAGAPVDDAHVPARDVIPGPLRRKGPEKTMRRRPAGFRFICPSLLLMTSLACVGPDPLLRRISSDPEAGQNIDASRAHDAHRPDATSASADAGLWDAIEPVRVADAAADVAAPADSGISAAADAAALVSPAAVKPTRV